MTLFFWRNAALCAVLSFCICLVEVGAKPRGGASVSGVVRDQAGAPFAGARVSLLNARQAIVATTESDAGGRYAFDDITPGSYEVNAVGDGFASARAAVQAYADQPAVCDLALAISPLTDAISVTADVGLVQDKDQLGQQVNVIPQERIAQRAPEALSQAVAEEVGVAVQRTSPTLGGVFIRGLTGRNIVVFVDGVRYTNSAQRGGINTFLNLLEPSNVRSLEILRGPNSSQYGSDSLGGSLQVVSQPAPFFKDRFEFHGQGSVFGSSASASLGQAARFSFGGSKYGVTTNLASRRVNTLRPGGGFDSRAAVTRFFGVRSDVINGDRLPDTAFTEYAGAVRFNYAPSVGHQIVFSYQRGQQDGGKRYDQMLGGDGNNIADLRNLMLDFGYVRYDTQRLPGLDSVSIGVSYNAQREERVNQGGNGDPRGTITSQYERTRSVGVQLFGSKLLPFRNTVLVGADFYRDRLTSPSFALNPATGAVAAARARIPNNALYNNYGFYAQDVWDVIPERLRLSASVRYGAVSYRVRAADNPTVGGRPLAVDDSLRADAVTFRTSAVFNVTRSLALTTNISRGFRAPNMTDLGTLGLTGNGFFEVAAPNLVGLNATIGSTADATAVTTGLPVRQATPEISLNYEGGVRYRNRRIDTDLGFFITNINDILTTQTLILPQGAVGQTLGSEVITSQLPTGAVFVAAATNPVRARANFSDVRIYGFEYTLNARLTSAISVGGNFTWLRAEDRATGAPPNVEGGTPPANGVFRVRYEPKGKRYWAEAFVIAADRQNRLSSLDLDDRRVGATRSRNQIRNFFRNGATLRGLVAAGPDGRLGTNDDVLRATGETLAQIQNRVLGSATQAPLFRAVNGYATLNLRGGFRVRENQDLFVSFENINDKNFRGISSGIDAPGRNVTVRYSVRF
jgi:outer membrane receptor protein involved in Fe transport